MPTKKRAKSRTTKMDGGDGVRPDVRALERRVRRLEAALARERERHVGRLERVRREANRRLAVMMQEIATLRHHEARAEALERLLAVQAPAPATKGSSNGEDSRPPG
jgi:hypothetical protein